VADQHGLTRGGTIVNLSTRDARDPFMRRLELLGASLGRTPLVPLRDGALDLHAKLEYTNPTGSSKDRSALWMLRRAVERGDVGPATTVVESSSGNLATSLAYFCRALGCAFVPVIDPHCNALTESYLRALCHRVEKVPEADDAAGYLRARLARVRRLRDELDPVYWPDQYANTDAMAAHFHSTGAELCRSLPRIDYLFVGVGTGGTIAGLSTRVKAEFPAAKVIAVDTEGSAIFGAPPRRRRIPGLGSSIRPPLCSRADIDDVVIVPEQDGIAGCDDLLRRHGLFAGGSTGSVYAAIGRYFVRHPPRRTRPTVVFLCADRGTPYADTVYDPAWVREHYDAGIAKPATAYPSTA
jgi:N-(2-amino-2-carboxyethyl)-L-glutamate synthase